MKFHGEHGWFFCVFLTREEITFCEVSTSGKFTWPKRNHFDLNHWVIMAAELGGESISSSEWEERVRSDSESRFFPHWLWDLNLQVPWWSSSDVKRNMKCKWTTDRSPLCWWRERIPWRCWIFWSILRV